MHFLKCRNKSLSNSSCTFCSFATGFFRCDWSWTVNCCSLYRSLHYGPNTFYCYFLAGAVAGVSSQKRHDRLTWNFPNREHSETCEAGPLYFGCIVQNVAHTHFTPLSMLWSFHKLVSFLQSLCYLALWCISNSPRGCDYLWSVS